jgi:hypothetical protein
MAKFLVTLLALCISLSAAFAPHHAFTRPVSKLSMAAEGEDVAAPLVSGAELEMMLTEFNEPLVVDAYATW